MHQGHKYMHGMVVIGRRYVISYIQAHDRSHLFFNVELRAGRYILIKAIS